ncbi:adenosinetriphosphatase [Cladochytrium replicatum]|nr:adenosinetriphosphatase [Cladochytrium replicatum]
MEEDDDSEQDSDDESESGDNFGEVNNDEDRMAETENSGVDQIEDDEDAPLIINSRRAPLAQRSANQKSGISKTNRTNNRKRKLSVDASSSTLSTKTATASRGKSRKAKGDASDEDDAGQPEKQASEAGPSSVTRPPARRPASKKARVSNASEKLGSSVIGESADEEYPARTNGSGSRAPSGKKAAKKTAPKRRKSKVKESDEEAASEFDDINDEDDDDGSDLEGVMSSDASMVAGPSRVIGRVARARTSRAGMTRSQREAARVASMGERLAARTRREWEDIYYHHPRLETIWDELEKSVATIEMKEAEQPENVLVKLLPFQLKGVYWLRKQEESETIQTIGLLVSTPHIKPNLIIAPTVAIMQWQAELNERTKPGTFSIYIHHGQSRTKKSDVNFNDYDVVLTTYATLENAFRRHNYGTKTKIKTAKKAKKEDSDSDDEFDEETGEQESKGKEPISGPTPTHNYVKTPSQVHLIKWGRIILDEAHSIKDRNNSTARAVFALQSDRRWSLTGTPLQNRVGEIYSLIRFMDADPFSYYFCKNCPCMLKSWNFKNSSKCESCGHTSHRHFCWWNMAILKASRMMLLLDRIMLRRVKIDHADDLGLPPRVVVVRRDVFNEPEEEFYESLYTDSKREFDTYITSNTVLNNYASIFSLLSRMRLAANHPDLVVTKLAIASNTAKETLVCGICQEMAEDAVISKCKHIFCREDIRQYIQSDPDAQPKCPSCFRALTIDLSQPMVESLSAANSHASIVNHIDMSRWRSSTKIEALVEELEKLQRDEEGGGATIKSIVFSQFVSFLDLVAWRLSRAGIVAVKLDGRMGPEQRQAVIDSFMKDPNVTVFLVSLKAGGVALNLTEASRVFVCDPWWNGSVEDQAFDRIHRLGQHRPIKITRLIIENSIESRILQLQEKKKALIASTVGKDMDALAKLSEEDLKFLFVL